MSKEEYIKLFEKDQNDSFIRLIIPASEPTDEYKDELNLIGKLPQDFSVDEIIRMKKYSEKLHSQIK